MSDQYDRVLIRLSSADDEKLGPILAKLLPLVFDDLLSQTEAAQRAKIVNILNHVLTRAKGNAAVKLPTLGIAERWFGPKLAASPNAPFFRNLSVIFLDLSVPRLLPEEQVELSLYALEHFGELHPGVDRVALLLSSIPGLGQIASEGRRKEQVPRCLAAIASRPSHDMGLAAFFHMATEFLLIPCGGTEAASVSGIASASWTHWKTRLKGKVAADMVAMKVSVLKWLGSLGADPPAALVYLPSLAATVENYDAVCTIAESNVKRLDPELDLGGDELLVGRLICAVITSAPPEREGAVDALHVEPKANVPAKLRTKVLNLLQRSKVIGRPAICPYVVHLIRQGLRENEQVQLASLQLAFAVSEHIEPEMVSETSATVLEDLESVFWPGGGVVSMGAATPLAFRVYGSFARQLGEHLSGEGRALALKSAPRMLALLAANDGAAQDILEALGGLVACMRGANEEDWRDLVPMLDRLVVSPKPVVRREVLRWATALFPTTSPEGRYYALRLFGDADLDIVRAAENALSVGKSEVPPFASMCSFLAMRALDGSSQGPERLRGHAEALGTKPPALPPLASGFSRSDIAQCVSFLLGLAEAEGLHSVADCPVGVSPPLAKKPRLSHNTSSETATGGDLAAVIVSLIALLDYVLIDAVEGTVATSTAVVADGATSVELGLRGLLLAIALIGKQADFLAEVLCRVELVLFERGTSSVLFRDGGTTADRVRRLGARVVGSICEHYVDVSGDPTERWLDCLSDSFNAPMGSGKRAGAVFATCEVLRGRACGPKGLALCQKATRFLCVDVETDPGIITATCDGLRRISERRRLVWEALEAGDNDAGAFTTRGALLDRLYELSKPVTSGLGDIKEAELGTTARNMTQATWRLLGQLAAWGGEEYGDCVDRLVAIGRKVPGEEAAAALGLALAASTSDPAAAAVSAAGQADSARAEALLRRLVDMSAPGELGQEAAEGAAAPPPAGAAAATTGEAAAPAAAAPGGEEVATKRARLAEQEADRRCGAVWLAVLLRQMARGGAPVPAADGLALEVLESLTRVFARATGDTSVFHADCGLKALCLLYLLARPEARVELVKAIFASFSNRTVVSNMFVGTPDTQARKEAKEAAAASGPDSLKITAKERGEAVKDLIFLARELQHPSLFIALLDQPTASVWTGEVFREALDLQTPCLPEELRESVCPTALRPKLFPPFFHPIAPVRQAVVALCASYFSCETPQQLLAKFPKDWPLVARHVVVALGSSRVSTREAAIGAALVLFKGKVWVDIALVYEDFWNIVIKLMDDMEPKIQEVVRPLVRTTRNLTLRVCDAKAGPTSDVQEAMKIVLPLLLKTCERQKHAQPLCFDVLREMVKLAHGTTMMSPYVQDLIPPLMISLSMMENSSYQYYQFHVDAANESKGKELEAARVSESRDSESMRLLRQLVPLVTAENAEELAPRTRDLLRHGVGANTRVGVCDFWAAVCAERQLAVPTGGKVATAMLRAVAGALLDGSAQVRGAAASCFASLARRNAPQDLTKVVFERLLRHDQEHRTDDAQRNAFRVSLARALWEVCRRCDDSILEPELKAAVAAKAFGLRYSEDQEVKSGWEALWSEVCPTISGGVERHRSEICGELGAAFEDCVSRAEKVSMAKAASALCTQLEKMQPRPRWAEDAAVVALHGAVLAALQSLPLFDGIGSMVRALADLSALLHRRKRNEAAPGGGAGDAASEASVGLPLILGFCTKGSLPDRGAAVRAALEVTSASRLWAPLMEVAQLHAANAAHVDELQREVEAEEREPGEAVPRKHRGKAQSPAEELLCATLDFWASTLEQCRREVEDEGDLEPPEQAELCAFLRAGLAEFDAGSLHMRIAAVRLWKRVFAHLAEEKLPARSRLEQGVPAQIAAALQDASLDSRSERLRRPALDLAAALATDGAPGGGREVLGWGLAGAVAAEAAGTAVPPRGTVAIDAWLARLDPVTADQCAESVKTLREAVGGLLAASS